MFRKGMAALAVISLFKPLSAMASQVVDLTTAGSSGSFSKNDFFKQVNPQSTGTGVIDSFLRIHQNGTESGFNTDFRPVPLNDVPGGFTHSIQLKNLDTFTDPAGAANGTYYRFILDINQNGSNPLLTMNSLQIYSTDDPKLTALPASAPLYDMQSAKGPGNTVEMNYNLNSGSGSGDVFFYVSTSLFSKVGANDYIVLYSSFGDPNASNDGFEEWAASTTKQGVPFNTPVPAGLPLALAGLATLGCAGLRRFRGRPVVAQA